MSLLNFTAIAVALKQAKTVEFRTYAEQILKNSKALAARLMHHGYSIATGGTENHLCLLDLRPKGTEGAKVLKFTMSYIRSRTMTIIEGGICARVVEYRLQ